MLKMYIIVYKDCEQINTKLKYSWILQLISYNRMIPVVDLMPKSRILSG
jgi:hypothetical protein